MTDPVVITHDMILDGVSVGDIVDGRTVVADVNSVYPADTVPTDSEKLDFLYQTAVRVQNLIDQVTPEDIGKIQRTVSNPLVRKMLGL